MATLQERLKERNRQSLKTRGYNFDEKGNVTRQITLSDGTNKNVSLDLYTGLTQGGLDGELYDRLNNEEKRFVYDIIKDKKIDVIDSKGVNHGQISYNDWLVEIGKKPIGNYWGIRSEISSVQPLNVKTQIDAEKPKTAPLINLYNAEAKYQKEKAAIEYANGVPEKYGYNAFDFDEKDLEEWAKKNNYVYAEEYSYNGGKMGKKLRPVGKVTEQQKKDGQVLMAVVENNRALKSSKTDWGAMAAGTHGFLDAATFGILPALTEWGSKSQYERAGLNPEYRVTTTESMGKTMAEHQTAGIVGSIAGGLATSIGVASGISSGLAKAGWATGKATIARQAVVEGLTGVIRGGITEAAAGGDWGDIGLAALRDGLTSGLGGAVDAGTTQALGKLFTNTTSGNRVLKALSNIKDTKLATIGINTVGGLADATMDTVSDSLFVLGANSMGADLEYRTGTDIVTDFGTTLILGTVMNMANSKAMSAEGKAKLIEVSEEYAIAKNNLFKSFDDTEIDYKEAADKFIELGNDFKKKLDGEMFPGQKKTVEGVKEYIDTVNDNVRQTVKEMEATTPKTPVSTEMKAPIAPKTTTAVKVPVSTEGGTVRQDVSGAIERVKNGTATNKDLDMFKASKTTNRKMLEDALGMKLPETNNATRKVLKELPARLNPTADNVTRLVGEGEKASVEASVEKIKTNLEGTGKDAEQLIDKVSNISDETVSNIKQVFGIEADYGKILDTNLKALADNPDNIISESFDDNVFVKGYADAIGSKLNGITPGALKNSYFGNAPINAKIAENFRNIVDVSAQRLKAEYDNAPVSPTSGTVEGETPNTRTGIPTYEEYKAEIEKHYPGIDEKYIQERYNARYSVAASPDVKSEATDIRIEVTNKVPSELEKTLKSVKVRTGIDIVFGNRYVDGEIDTNFRGMFDGKKIIVSENATKADVFNAVVLHELTHGIEGTKKYKGIYDYVLKEMYGDDAARLDADVETKIAEYKKNGIELTPERAKGEIVAENVGKYIFADDVVSIVAKNYTLGQKILDVINELIYNIKKKFGNTFELNELEAAQRKYRMALDDVKRNGVTNPNKAYAMGNKVYDYTKSFAEQVDDWKAGKIPQYDTLLIGKTPDVFKNIGLNSLPFTINQTHVDYAVNGTKDADHYIGEDMLKQLPQALENPVAIFQDTRNANIDNRLIALLKLTHNGKQVIMPVSIDGFGVLNSREIDSNAVVSVFAKGNSVESMLNDALLAENYGNKSMFYWNKKEALPLLQRARVQYPSSLPQDGFIHSIRENDAFVNYRLENVTHSKQFKDWFGDWLKNPQKASKIVNEDGTPMVVYHGTDAKFNVFDMGKGRANMDIQGSFFSPWELDAQGYGGNVGAYYLNIKNPADGPTAYAALNRFKGQDNAGVKAKEYLIKQGYDGVNFYDEEYVAFYPTQIKSATDNIGTFDRNNPDFRYSFASQNDIDSALADFEAHYGEMYRGLIDKYGTIKPGEIPQVEDVKVPKKSGERQYVSNYARTMAETKVFSDAMQGEFEKMVVDGTLSHERISNKSAESDAGSRIVRLGFEGAVNEFETLVNSGRLNKNDIALGQTLLNVACQNKDVELAKKLAVDLSMAATQFGQNVQAFSMLKRMSPDGQLYYLEKTVQKINDDIVKKYNGKKSVVEIDNKLAEDLLNAKNQDEINEAVYAIEKNIGEQMPANWVDKWNAWRYLAMLGNTRTHFRNIVGNMGFVPARKLKDLIGTTIEKIVLPKNERTKAYTKTKESKEFAKQDFKKMSEVIKGNEGKYDTQRGIEEYRQIFKTKWLEAVRKFNGDALEWEDGLFLELAYKDAFAQAMTARGLTSDYLSSGTKEANADLQKIREYAINEAQKATYRDSNAFSEFVNKFGFKGDNVVSKTANILVEGILPFKKTPANILVRGVEYSPVGLIKTITADSYKLKNGDISASKYIDNLSSGLTGTGIAALGAFLSHLGILVVSPDEDEDIASYKKMMGAQNYALKFGDNTYTIDWMAPSSLPLFVGAEAYNTAKSTEGFTFKNVTDAMSRISEPMFELSCLSGVQDALESIKYAEDGNTVTSLIADVIASYVSQALPTIGGQFARTIDDTQRNAYYKDKKSTLPVVVESFINKAKAKIPFVSKMLPEKIDRWGRTQKYGGTVERVLENFASPGYYSKEAPTWTDKRIMEIYKNTGNKSVIPKNAPKSFEVKGEMVYLSPDEYVEYSKTKGQLSYKYVTEFLKIPSNIDDETRVEIISAIYEYSNAKAKEKVSDYELAPKYQKVDDAMKRGTSPAKYYFNYYKKKKKD
jgi:hypothetical protein